MRSLLLSMCWDCCMLDRTWSTAQAPDCVGWGCMMTIIITVPDPTGALDKELQELVQTFHTRWKEGDPADRTQSSAFMHVGPARQAVLVVRLQVCFVSAHASIAASYGSSSHPGNSSQPNFM